MSAPPEPSQAPAFYNAEHYDPSKLVPENSVGYLMRKVMSSIRTQADAQLALHELTYAQWLPLFKLSLCETATVASLARDLETDPASMTRSLDRMEAKGLVVRERSTVDRRVVQLRLTPEGQRIAALVPPVLADVLNGHLSDFSHDEWQLLLSMLRRMLANGEALRQQPPHPPNPQPVDPALLPCPLEISVTATAPTSLSTRSALAAHLAVSAVALAAALLLVGCANPGPAHTPLAQATPAAAGLTATTTDVVAPSQWWKALGDEQLNTLIDTALQGNPSLAVSRARLEQAVALSQVREAANGPQATLGVDATRQRYTANGLVPAPVAGNTYNSGTVQATLSWSPDFFGQHAAELQAALGQARAAQADAAAAANTLAAQVGRSYVALARLVAQRDVATRALEQREEQRKLTQERTSAGLDSQVELTQAQAAVPDARTQIEALEEQITLARRQLAVLTGQAPDALPQLTPRLAALQPTAVPEVLGADLLGRRPDVVAARWRVEAATQGVNSARSEFYPNINIGAFIGLNSLGLDRLFNGSSRQMGVTPALRLPIFDGGRLRAQLGGRAAELDVAIAQYNGAVLDAVKEAGDAVASIQSLTRQQALQDEAVASAEKAYRFAQERYRAGLGNYLVVLSTESQVLAQRRLAVDLRARQLDTRLVLMKALGGGWADDTAVLHTAAAH